MVMRILHVNNYHFARGGSDRYFLDVVRGLTERGHDVRTLAPTSARDTDTDLRTNSLIRPLSTSKRPRPAELVRFFYNLAARDAVRQVIFDFQPDIVHLHIYYGQLSSSILQPIKEAGIPIIQTLHEYKIVCPAQTMMRNHQICTACQGGRYWNAALHKCNRGSLSRSALSAAEVIMSEWLGARRYVDRFLAVSEFQRQQLLLMGIERQKIALMHNFTPTAANASNSQGNYFLFAGRITPGKGLETLVRAYRHYRDRCGDVAIPLHIAGEGEAELEIKGLIKRYEVADNVTWLGHCTGDTLGRIYRDCRALINPSELNETFGLNNIEAMAHGRPVICSDSGAFSEVVRDGIDGFVVQAGDISGFAAKMCALTPELTRKLGRQAYERTTQIFSKEAHMSKLERIYSSMIEKSTSPTKPS